METLFGDYDHKFRKCVLMLLFQWAHPPKKAGTVRKRYLLCNKLILLIQPSGVP